MTDSGTEWINVAQVRRAHGIRGEVVVEVLTDDPAGMFAPGRQLVLGDATGGGVDVDAPVLTVRRAKPFKRGWILRFDQIPDRSAAEHWRDRYLLVDRESLNPRAAGEVYYHELVGLRVELPDGHVVGVVDAWLDLPQGLMLDVRLPGGEGEGGTAKGSIVIPYRPEMIAQVDVAGGRVVIDPPPGLLE